jgi:Domain of unknown function (DUF397)
MSAVPSTTEGLAWRVPSACESGACVMVARRGDYVLVGNTNQPDGPISTYTRAEWREFLKSAKQGEFDDLA